MAIILTDHDANIIAWSREPWRTPGEYANPIFRVVLLDVPEGQQPVSVTDLGPATSREFDTHAGSIYCPRVHEQAIVEFEALPEAAEGD